MTTNKLPLIKSVMTPFPHSIELSATVGDAAQMMVEHEIHHLPVTRDSKLVGIVSERDVRLATGMSTSGESSVPLETVCQMDPYVVDLDERLDNVVMEMERRGIGSALVTRKEVLAGILTTRDVCRLLGETLRKLYGPAADPDGDDAA